MVSDSGARGPGRPRQEAIDTAVFAATGDVLAVSGIGAVSIQDIARRAGVSRTAVYRRWPNRTRLVLALLGERLGEIEAPRSGCTVCDLHEILTRTTDAFCRIGAGTLAALLAQAETDRALRDDLLEAVIEPARRALHRTLFDARERGDLRGDVDLQLTVDALASLVLFRLLLDQNPMTEDQIEDVVLTVLRGIAVDSGTLVAAYEAREDVHQGHRS